MSIASEIERIRNAKNALKSVINARGGSLAGETLEYYAAAVSALPSGDGSVDLSFVTAKAADIRSGKVGASTTGTPVVGTLDPSSGSSGMDFYKCASVDTANGTWTGYKAVLTDGIYTFEKNVTAGLTYSDIIPEVNRIYSADALIVVSRLYDGADLTLVFYASLSGAQSTAETGQALTASGNVTYSTVDGIPCAVFDGSSYFTVSGAALPTGNSKRTMSAWVKAVNYSSQKSAFGYGALDSNQACSLDYLNGNTLRFCGWYADTDFEIGSSGTLWHHVALVYDGTNDLIYWDGVLVKTQSQYRNTPSSDLTIGGFYSNWQGNVAALRIYNRVLSDDEITALAGEFDVK